MVGGGGFAGVWLMVSGGGIFVMGGRGGGLGGGGGGFGWLFMGICEVVRGGGGGGWLTCFLGLGTLCAVDRTGVGFGVLRLSISATINRSKSLYV